MVPTVATPTTHPRTNAGPFERALGVASIRITPMIGIGLIPAATANARICPVASPTGGSVKQCPNRSAPPQLVRTTGVALSKRAGRGALISSSDDHGA